MGQNDPNAWRYELQPVNPANYTGTFAYDQWGRTTDVWKLQSTTVSPWKYVQTHSIYNAPLSPPQFDLAWGQAISVVEDYGGINRTTQNVAYTSWGKPCQVIDGAGHTFSTNYDADGKVKSVWLGQPNSGQPLVTYTYGAPGSGLFSGVPSMIVDNLTGVTQSLQYQTASQGFGQVLSVVESGSAHSAFTSSYTYTTSYTYTPAGDRLTATYLTPDGQITWTYGDVVPMASFDQGKRVFQTLNRMNSSGGSSPEEMHYEFDTAGRLREAAFAQSPQTAAGAPTSAPYYTTNYPAASRAIAFYDYDGGGRRTSIQHGWQTWSGSSYNVSQCILANFCNYDLTRDLKLSSAFSVPTVGNATTWTTSRTEQYGYDAALDYLTSANYDDGLVNATPSWSYDATGNRTDSQCDNLNRTTSISGTAVTCDTLGNRTTLGSSTTYTWDCLNRMTAFATSGTTVNCEYRGDCIRTRKVVGSVLSEYFHDGQMPMEDAVINGSSSTVTRYGLGARGIDYEEEVSGATNSLPFTSFPNVGFPIYDIHGNMIATLARAGSNGYAVNNQRSYDAWGNIRSGTVTGDPKNRYCGNLGHQQDDDSGLIYMRARYYEPGSGRFISEDPGRDGCNWYSYSRNCPTNLCDSSGKNPAILWVALFFIVVAFLDSIWTPNDPVSKAVKVVIASICAAFGAVKSACAFLAADEKLGPAGAAIGAGVSALVAGALAEIALQQLACALILMEDPDNSWCIQSAGHPAFQFGL